MKILLTGSTGFLGKYIYNTLSTNHDILTIGRSNCDIKYNFDKLINFLPECELIIHAAGVAHILTNSKLSKDIYYDFNVNGTDLFLKSILKSYKPKQFVFISSVGVYGLIKGDQISENSSLLATDYYGKSKIESEKIIIDWCCANNIKYTILRLPLVVGTNPPGNLRSLINSIKHGYYFNISSGKVKKSMVLAEDVASHIIQAAKVGGIYNLTDGYHPSFNELSRYIADQLGLSKIYSLSKNFAKFLAIIGDIIGDKFPLNTNKFEKITSSLTFDDTKARNNFGWNPKQVLNNFIVN